MVMKTARSRDCSEVERDVIVVRQWEAHSSYTHGSSGIDQDRKASQGKGPSEEEGAELEFSPENPVRRMRRCGVGGAGAEIVHRPGFFRSRKSSSSESERAIEKVDSDCH